MSGQSSDDSMDFSRDSLSEITPHGAARRALGALVDELKEGVVETSEAIKQSSSKHKFDPTVVVVTADAALVEALRAGLALEVFQAETAAAALLAAGAPFVRLVVIDAALAGADALREALPTAVMVDGREHESMVRTVQEALSNAH